MVNKREEQAMSKHVVSLVRYDGDMSSIHRAVDLAGGIPGLGESTRVFIKPNVVFWTAKAVFPPWGVITTSRVVEAMVRLLAEHGVRDITLGEGTVVSDPKNFDTAKNAHEVLGYYRLAEKYGLRVVDVMARPFEPVDMGDGIELNFNVDALGSDLIIDLPVMKTHVQTVVSLGIKNLKGLIDIKSRKKCHSPDPDLDLHHYVARMADPLPPVFTLIDGIYTSEWGPGPNGTVHRSDVMAASSDILSVDLVGARLLGHDPAQVPHLAMAAANRGRGTELDGIEVVGESIDELATGHEYTWDWNQANTLPQRVEDMGIKGLYVPKYDSTICTYCAGLSGLVMAEALRVWDGNPFDEVEILSGKAMKPSPGKNKTILLGKCMFMANRKDPNIKEMLAVKGCPPDYSQVAEMLHQAGIEVNRSLFENFEALPGFFMQQYQGREEFDMDLFRVAP